MATDSEESDVDNYDSDKELQVAFSTGLLKPGLNVETAAPQTFANNVVGLAAALNELKNGLPWVERLDLTVEPTPTPRAMDAMMNVVPDEANTVHDDFKREMIFYRQAQAAVLAAMPRLHKLNLLTKRPDDYFAQMAKTDAHMKKVRENLQSQRVSIEHSEKAKKMRDLRKFGKKVQQEVIQKRHKEKRDMLNAVKKYQKGQKAKLDFLDDEKSMRKNSKKPAQQAPHTQNDRRKFKNSKFGFGGQKKRSKYNTADSSASLGTYSRKENSTSATKRTKQASKGRPGKNRRQTMKNKKKR